MNEKQKIAHDAFLLGVDWTLEMVIKTGDVFGMTERDAELFREKARKVLIAKNAAQK